MTEASPGRVLRQERAYALWQASGCERAAAARFGRVKANPNALVSTLAKAPPGILARRHRISGLSWNMSGFDPRRGLLRSPQPTGPNGGQKKMCPPYQAPFNSARTDGENCGARRKKKRIISWASPSARSGTGIKAPPTWSLLTFSLKPRDVLRLGSHY